GKNGIVYLVHANNSCICPTQKRNVSFVNILYAQLLFDYIESQLLAYFNNGLPGDTGENISQRRCINFIIFLYKNVLARRLCNKSILIQHECFIKALLYRIRACQYRIDILPRNLGIDMKRLWTWTFDIRDIDAQKVLPQIRAPFPSSQHNIGVHRTCQMHIRTRKHQWPNIGCTQVVDLQQLITLFDQGVDIPMKR